MGTDGQSDDGTATDAAQVLRRLVDLREPDDADGAHLLVDVILVAAALPDQDTALYAAEHLHRAIDALGRHPA